MADFNKHIVNRIYTTISCSRRDLPKIQQMGLASGLLNYIEELSPVLDRKYGKKTVRLESLTIELEIKNHQLPDLSGLLARALTEALDDLEKKGHGVTKSTYKEAKPQSHEDIFFYFLDTGQMPWFSTTLQFDTIDFSSDYFKTRLATMLKSSPKARERLVDQFTADQQQLLLKLLYPEKFIKALFQFIKLVMDSTRNFSERFAAGYRLGQLLLRAFLDFVQGEDKSPDFIKFVLYYRSNFVAEVQQECNGKHREFLQFLEARTALDFKLDSTLSPVSGEALLYGTKAVHPNEKKSALAKAEFVDQTWGEAKNENHQFVLNAGTILLHPFLTRFFDKVGLLENNKFISPSHQQRGICLLHNLATGERMFPEEQLMFFKFLCNYPLNQTVPKELPISDFELEEVRQLLQAAIDHWTALKHTSIDGLRINFLQRKGLLEEDAMGYTLNVESETSDILIDQLPWGLSAVYWPWLPTVLTIKWR